MEVDPTDKSREESFEKCVRIDKYNAGLRGSHLCLTSSTVAGVPVRVGVLKLSGGSLSGGTLKAIMALKAEYGLDVIGVQGADISGEIQELLELSGIKVIGGRVKEARSFKPSSYVIRPQLTAEEAYKIFTGRVKKQIIGRIMGPIAGVKAEFLGHELAYYPLRCYRALANRRFQQKEELVMEELEICFELSTGSLVTVEDEELVIGYTYLQLGELDDIAVSVFEQAGMRGEVSMEEIIEYVGSAEIADAIIKTLIEYGLLEPAGLDTYIPRVPQVEGRGLLSFFREKGLIIEGTPPRCSRILGPGIDVRKLDRIMEVIGTVQEIADIYFPVYVGVFKKYRGEQSIEVAVLLDAVWGNRMEEFEEIVASSKVIYDIDDIINAILQKKGQETRECVSPESR
ncbi:MAG: hypothetical protein F7C35_02270 [Desulfurococcales archaeon]|nr:hypothetical protein [Desulfurococcales archaeon]